MRGLIKLLMCLVVPAKRLTVRSYNDNSPDKTFVLQVKRLLTLLYIYKRGREPSIRKVPALLVCTQALIAKRTNELLFLLIPPN